MYIALFGQMKKQLGQLDTWFDAAHAAAATRKFDANQFLTSRLAPDQFPLTRQVQITCDTAKRGAAFLAGTEAPSHPDTEQTIDELRTRIRWTADFLGSFTPAQMADAATRVVTQPRWEGKVMSGADYFVEHVVPNFYFHLSHCYAILRHGGVPLGKRDYLGALSQKLP